MNELLTTLPRDGNYHHLPVSEGEIETEIRRSHCQQGARPECRGRLRASRPGHQMAGLCCPVTSITEDGRGLPTLLIHQHCKAEILPSHQHPACGLVGAKSPSTRKLATLLGLWKVVFLEDSLEGLWKRLQYMLASSALVTCRQASRDGH